VPKFPKMRLLPSSKTGVLAILLLGTAGIFSAFQSFQINNTSNAVPEANFVNFESAHVHPMDMTPDETKLLAVNTANNSLEVFQVQDGDLLNIASIPVGLDPVTVRVLNNTTAWVVNNVSDNISIVDLTQLAVVRSIRTENEPSDVVFAGTPQKAFVSCAERESIQVFDLSNLDLAPNEILLKGEQPRAMAVSPDGSTVYTAFFESGNQTTVIPGSDFMAMGFSSPQGGSTSIANDVRNVNGPYGGVVPVPNDGAGFNPPMNPLLPVKDDMQSLVVRKNSSGQWLDDNGGNWTNMVSGGQGVRVAGWDVLDNDVAVLNANSLALSYQKHLGNILMAMDVNPVTGKVSVVGTDATNEIRFEPNLRGVFLRVNVSQFIQGSATNDITDLNGHLTYASHTVPVAEREKSIGDPRAIVWKSDGTKAYVSGMGSNNVITIDQTGARTNPLPINVGEGPTGIVIDETRNQVYVLNKFSGTISTIDMTNDQQVAQTEFFDPTPLAIKVGRKHLYNTHIGSGNGHISCGSCHVDGKWDRLAWDLGNPAGDMEVHDTVTFHPLKGLKTTQFLIDILDKGTGKLHWRGDKDDFFQFAGAFKDLQGNDAPLDSAQMQEFMDFLGTTYHVPNPYRPFRPETQSAGSRLNPGRVRGPGTTFQTIQTVSPIFISINNNCSHCHLANTGRGVTNIQPGNDNMGADLRSTYKKIGFWYSSTENTAGFGLMSDGSFESKFNTGGTSDYFGDYEGELLSFAGGIVQTTSPQSFNFNFTHTSQDSHAAVGLQETLNGAIGSAAEVNDLRDFADDYNELGLIVTGMYQGEQRGFYYLGSGSYQSDVAGQTVTHNNLVAAAQATNGEALSWMLVHDQVKGRAVDRNMDGTLDGDDTSVRLVMRSRLQGAHVGAGDMSHDLILSGLLPAADPYGSGMLADDAIMVTSGALSPVDWMEVELRDAINPSVVVAYKSVMLLSNGKLVEPSGGQTLIFDGIAPGDYYVAVRHRNHLGAMTASGLMLSETPELLDFTSSSTATYGSQAQYIDAGVNMLWMGDVNQDGSIKYTGSANDRDVILLGIGGAIPTNVVSGYMIEDANLDGEVKYIGAANDRDPVLLNIGGSVPTNVRTEQLP
jgi:DNA-binding beta-propeller fold protein YncE